jgi:hypothetical protein
MDDLGLAVRERGRVGRDVLRRPVRALIVGALVGRPGSATPHIGSHTLHVLEFSCVPVMVVPLGDRR